VIEAASSSNPSIDLDPSKASTVDEFITILGKLRMVSGESYERLSKRCGVPRATLNDLFKRTASTRAPRPEIIERLIAAYAPDDRQAAEWMDTWKRLVIAEPTPEEPIIPVKPANRRRLWLLGVGAVVILMAAVIIFVIHRNTSADTPAKVGSAMAATPAPTVGRLRNDGADRCLGLTGQSRRIGTIAILVDCSDSDASQVWEVSYLRTVDQAATFRNRSSGYCLGVSGGSQTAGALVILVTCDLSFADHSQVWHNVWHYNARGIAYKNGHSPYCLGVHLSAREAGAQLVQGPCTSDGTDRSEVWQITGA
jgi:hypothetical protein